MPVYRMPDLKAQLRALRGKTTQQEIADIIGVAQSTYALYEKGDREPSLDAICKLANYYSVTTDYILGLSDLKNPENKAAVNDLGLLEENIALLKSDFFDRHPMPEDKRTLRDIFNTILSDDNFLALLELIGKRTLPKNHWGAASWGDSPMKPMFIGNSGPNGELMDAAYKQMAHDILDSIIEHIGKISVEKFYNNNLN